MRGVRKQKKRVQKFCSKSCSDKSRRGAKNVKTNEKYRTDLSHRARRLNVSKLYAQKRHLEVKANPELLAAHRVRKRMRRAALRGLAGEAATSVTLSNLGYTPKELLDHLLKTLPTGATLQDFVESRLHIDHIRPLATFTFTDPQHLKQAHGLANLRLLWAKENISKGSLWHGVRHRVVSEPQ